MKKTHLIHLFLRISPLLLFCACTDVVQNKSTTNSKPNIVLILSDDLGFSDIGSYGSEIKTPNLDRLAESGVRFKEFYTVSICAPTRASLLTGQYQHDAGVGYFAVNLGIEAYQGYLSKNTLTIAEVLKENGYSTLMGGKWHVGNDSIHWPNQRGFDEFYGFPGGASSFFSYNPFTKIPTQLVKNNVSINAPDDSTFYLTNEITREAIGMIQKNETANKPFFLYLAYNAPHWPLHALPSDIEKYKSKYDEGWDVIRSRRHENLVKLGIISNNQPIAPRPTTIPDWESLSVEEKRSWASRMEVHAAMIDNMDSNIGLLIDYLKETGQYENTAFFFISDNGAAGEDVEQVFRRAQANAAPTGAETLPSGFNAQGPLGSADSYYSITHRWAYAANSPFSYWKTFPYEGGISSPFIARLPGQLTENKIITGRGHLIDILPTILEISGAKYPTTYHETNILPLPGNSLVSIIEGKSDVKGDTLFFERGGNRAVRAGKWKILTLRGHNKWKLFAIDTDRGETMDLANDYPEVVQNLVEAYDLWAKNHQVVNTDSLLHTTPAAAGMLQFEERINSTIPEELPKNE